MPLPLLADLEDMAPDLILVVAGLSAAWAVLSIVGGERQRVLQNAEILRRTAPPAEAEEVYVTGQVPAAANPTATKKAAAK